MKRFLFYLYIIGITLILTELVLRIYNPFPNGIKGDKIVLGVNATLEFENTKIPAIERKIVYTKNELGFRGPGKPKNWEAYTTIIMVGGSTTECTYLSEGKTWSDKLLKEFRKTDDHIWINNAGFAGHSTFGHKILLEDYVVKLKPDMIVFLIGCNDIARDDLVEDYNMKGVYKSIGSFFVKNSELCNTLSNFLRAKRAVERHLNDHYIDLSKNSADTIFYSNDYIQAELDRHKIQYLPDYRKRVESLIAICKRNGIDPVFITQPSLFGEGKDPETGADLELRNTGFRKYNGKLWWSVLELYNDVTRTVAEEHKLLLIDLARKMPKSSRYFYDLVHFTNEGADMASRILYPELARYLKGKGFYRSMQESHD